MAHEINSRIRVIVNPASGSGRTGTTWSQHEPYLRTMLGDAGIDVVFTRAVRDASIMAHQALKDGYDHIIAVGGDGTFSEIVNGFFINDRPVNPQAAVSFIPSGTGSDIARTLHLPADKNDAIKRIAKQKALNTPQMLDVGKVQYTRFDNTPFTGYFCNVLSFGMGGEVVQHVNQAGWLKRFGGKITFLTSSLLTLLTYTNKNVRLKIFHDDVQIADEIVNTRIIAVANGKYFGGSMMIAPEASPNDGLFDIVTVENLSALGAARKMPLIYTGDHIGDASVRAFRGNRIIAESTENVLIDADGEGPGKLPLEIEVLPHVLPFI